MQCKHPVGDDDVEEVDTEDADGAAGGYRSNDDGREEDVAQNGTKNLIFAEVILNNKPKGKNDSGSRHWQGNHCKHSHKSSSTISLVLKNGTKPPITRCDVLSNNRIKYQ